MADGQNRAMPENLKKRLAVAVRSIQWSYAIFWSVSATQPGGLEWGDGYYNGDIKTRKTIQAVEIKADQLGLQRSEQLKELYESLSAGESSTGSQLPRRASVASLSPEDLTDTEWYYLVCMSFVFTIGEGMPGRTMAAGEPIWLCNAHNADSKVFSRSLLAKSALVQTVVCFPFQGGVVEIGTTEHVTEDLNLIQRVKTSLLEAPLYATTISNGPDYHHDILNHGQILARDDKYVPAFESAAFPVASPSRTANGFDPEEEEEPEDDSFMVEGLNGGGASQVQSWQLVDEELSNCIHQSLNSSDCISQTFVEPGKIAYGPRKGKVQENRQRLGQIQEQISRAKMTPFNPRNDDLHYQGVLSTIFKTTHHLILGPQFQNCDKRSSFTRWKSGGFQKLLETKNCSDSQKALKKVLFDVPRMHQNERMGSPEDSGIRVDDETTNHAFSERKRRENLNERFMILRSIIPSTSKVDKVSILDETIGYLQELQKRVEELESYKESTNSEMRLKKRKNPCDAGERTSANCGNIEIGNGKRVSVNQRRASNNEEADPETGFAIPRDGLSDNLRIGSFGNEVVIELRCAWREGILFEIMNVVSDLNLDSHSMHSSTGDGFLYLTIKCKHKGLKVATHGMIKEAIQRVAWIC